MSLDPGVGEARASVHGVREYAHLDTVLAQFLAAPVGGGERARLRGHLVTGYAPLVRNIASRYRLRGEPVDDLVQVGTIGLLKAVDRFDPAAGAELIAFAVPTITGEIRRHFRDRTWAMRVPRRLVELQSGLARAQDELTRRLGRAPRVSEIAAELDVDRDTVIDALQAADSHHSRSLDQVLGDDAGDTVGNALGDADPEFDLVEVRETLRPAISRLPDRERTILLMRFFGGRTQSEIAAHLGISQMHVSRLLSTTLDRLRRQLDQP